MEINVYDGKTSVTTVLLTGFLAVLLLTSSCRNAPGKPAPVARAGLFFATDTLDIGALHTGQQKTFSIGINNHSDTAVAIQKFVSSCKCLVLDSQAVTLPGGSNLSLKANFEAQPDEKGEIFRYIGIRTNEPTPFKIAVIRAKII